MKLIYTCVHTSEELSMYFSRCGELYGFVQISYQGVPRSRRLWHWICSRVATWTRIMCFVESKRGAVYPYDSRCTVWNRSYCSFLIGEQSKLCELQVQIFFNRYRKVSDFYSVKFWSLGTGHFDYRMCSFFLKQSSWKNLFSYKLGKEVEIFLNYPLTIFNF